MAAHFRGVKVAERGTEIKLLANTIMELNGTLA
jgi:hypothetical protein